MSFLTQDDEAKQLPVGPLFVDGISFFGSVFSKDEIFVSSNGYVTLGEPFSEFNPLGIGEWGDSPIIAGHFDDYDVSKGGEIRTSIEDKTVTITWDKVAPFEAPLIDSQKDNPRNTFSILLVDDDDTPGDGIPGEWEIRYSYGPMEWTGGSPSAAPGTAGYNSLTPGGLLELPGSGTTDLLQNITNEDLSFTVADGFPKPPDLAGNAISQAAQLGQIRKFPVVFNDFLGPRLAVDTVDYIQFELGLPSELSLVLTSQPFLGTGEGATPNFSWIDGNGGHFVPTFNQSRDTYTLDAGIYYLQIEEQESDIKYALSLTADSDGFDRSPRLDKASPVYLSATGQAEFSIRGANLFRDIDVKLLNSENVPESIQDIRWINNTELIVVLDQLPEEGTYNISVSTKEGSTVLPNAFTQLGIDSNGELEINLSVPGLVRPNWISDAVVSYENVGSSPIISPIITLEIDGGEFDRSLTNSTTIITQTSFSEDPIQFLALDTTGDASVLLPGESGSQIFRFRLADGSTQARFQTNTVDPRFIINWDILKDTYKPTIAGTSIPSVSTEAWELIWDNFRSAVGTTSREYAQRLSASASALEQINQPIPDIEGLIQLEIRRAGLDGEIAKRFEHSPFGLGQRFAGDIRLEEIEESTILLWIAGEATVLRLSEEGSFLSSDGGELIADSTGQNLRFTDLRGNQMIFDATGNILRTQNSVGIGANFSYNNEGRLQEIISDNGVSTTFQWLDNRIAEQSTVDGEFFVHESFTYDVRGRLHELIRSVGEEVTRTTYEYHDTLPAKNAVKSITSSTGNRVEYEYDTLGQIKAVRLLDGNGSSVSSVIIETDGLGSKSLIDQNGVASTFISNAQGLVARVIGPSGLTVDYRYDSLGRMIQIISDGVPVQRFTYAGDGTLDSTANAAGATDRFTIDSRGLVDTLTDANGNITTYEYTPSGLQTEINYANGSIEQFEYDLRGNLVRRINRRGQESTYSYDDSSRIVSQTTDGSTTTYSYNSYGLLESATRQSNDGLLEEVWKRSYDETGRLVSAVGADGLAVAITYDSEGRRKTLTYPDGYSIAYKYDSFGRLIELEDQESNQLLFYSYDAEGRLSEERKLNGTQTSYTYSDANKIESIENSSPDGTKRIYQYSYDSAGFVTSLQTPSGLFEYIYDEAGQLSGVKKPDGEEIEYIYDAAGNRLEVVGGPFPYLSSVNSLNQIVDVVTEGTSNEIKYDADGNLIQQTINGVRWEFQYNSRNQLIEIREGDVNVWKLEYDIFGNRYRIAHNESSKSVVYDPLNSTSVLYESTSPSTDHHYLHGLGLEALSEKSNNLNWMFYEFDQNGSATAITDSNGDPVNTYLYMPFGRLLDSNEENQNDYQYIGQYGVRTLSSEGNASNVDLPILMGARHYSTLLGRFNQPDPIGVAGGTNLYLYGKNNPILFIDPLGLSPAVGTGESERQRRERGLAAFEAILEVATVGATVAGVIAAGGIAAKAIALGTLFGPVYSTGINIQKAIGILPPTASTGSFIEDITWGTSLEKSGKILSTSIDIVNIYNGLKSFPKRLLDYDFDKLSDVFYRGPRDLLKEIYGAIKGVDAVIDLTDRNNPRTPSPTVPPSENPKSGQTDAVTSLDPNDVVGPSGFGPDKLIFGDGLLPYLIRFENLSAEDREEGDLAVAAQRVTVSSTLDSDLDFSTFQLLRVGFGPYTFGIPDGFQSYSAIFSETEDASPITFSLDLDGPDGPEEPQTIRIDVGLTIDFDVQTGELLWILDALDPSTGKSYFEDTTGSLSNALIAGILPPNNEARDGEGFLSYIVKTKQSIQTGDVLEAQASIIFDDNEAIETPVWSNEIDKTPPAIPVINQARGINKNILSLKGTAEPGSTTSIILAGEVIADVATSISGEWEALLRDLQVESFYTFTAMSTDGVGNKSGLSNEFDAQYTVLQPLGLSADTAQLLYVAYYGRPADFSGLNFWEDNIAKAGFTYSPRRGDGLTDQERPLYDSIVNDFGNSPEAQDLYAGKTSQERVNTVYNFLFGRNAENDPITGVNFWVDQLQKDAITLPQLAVEVALGAGGEDLLYLTNKLESANRFLEAMDTPLERAAYSGEQDNLIARDWLAQYDDDVATPSEVDAVLAQIINAGPPPSLDPLSLSADTAQLLYVAYYGRPADFSGLNFWEDNIAKAGFTYSPRRGDGLTDQERPLYDSIINDFGNSPEAQDLYAGLTSQERVNAVYNSLFGRVAENDPITGVNFWVDQLQKDAITLPQLAVEVALGAGGEDLLYLTNKLESANRFLEAMDTPLERAAYSGEQDNLIARDWLAQYDDDVASISEVDAVLAQIVSTI